MKRSLLITGIAIIALLTACSGGGSDVTDSAARTTTESTTPVPTPASPSTSASTTSTARASTSTSTTTTATAPLSTTPTTPVATPAPTAEEVVAAAAVESREAYLYAVYNVDVPDALVRLRASTTGPSLELGLANYQSIVDNGWRVRPNPDVPSALTPESIELLDEATAEAIVCVVSAGVVFAPGANPDGTDLIVNADISASRDRITLVLEAGAWKLREGTTIETWSGETSCPAG